MVANDNTTKRYQNSHSLEDAGASEVEDLFGSGHKVVAYPASNRGRLSVLDVVSSKYTQPTSIPSPKRERRRSLSAGRSRDSSPRRTDIVQHVYDKLGVNLKKGQSYLDAPKTACTTSSPLRQRTEKIQERYRNALSSRGRDSNTIVDLAKSKSSDDVLETRSLSGGSRLMTSRWPPASATTSSTAATQAYGGFNKSKSSSSNNSNSNSNNNHNKKATANEALLALKPSSSSTSNKPVLHIGRTMSKEEELLMLQEVPPPPLSTSSTATTEQQDTTPTEQDAGSSAVLLSFKDRMRMYGSKASGINNNKNRTTSGTSTGGNNIGLRSVDPEYAAQFASRQLPPKVDIYEGGTGIDDARSKDECEEEKKEDDGVREPESSPANLQQQPTATASTEVSNSNNSSNHSRFVKKQQGAETSSVANTAAAPSASTVTTSTRVNTSNKNSRVASAFLAAVQLQGGNKPTMSSHLISGNSSNNNNNNNHEFDDNESFTSSLSGEGINAKSRWQQPQQNNNTQERNRLSAYANASANAATSSLTNTANSSINNNNNDLQRLVDERVQAQMATLVQKVEERMTLRLQVTEERLLSVEAELSRLRNGYK